MLVGRGVYVGAGGCRVAVGAVVGFAVGAVVWVGDEATVGRDVAVGTVFDPVTTC